MMSKLTYPWRSEKDAEADEELCKLPCVFTGTKQQKLRKKAKEEEYIERMIARDKAMETHNE